ncbi:MAG: phosphohydrolase [Candidatus Magnetomorum sp.]|nr:phosphohydrolase [Candidatus Magnetomorum sp.]
MNPLDILTQYYSETSDLFFRLRIHSELVAQKSLQCAKHLNMPELDLAFIWEAAMLHDIGIFMTHAPQIGCYGERPYICHGHLGMQLLNEKGMHRHARVCERHVGVGLTVEEIHHQQFPLPEKDMQPETIAEQIICYADKFYSKSTRLFEEKSIETIEQEVSGYRKNAVTIFRQWHERFHY